MQIKGMITISSFRHSLLHHSHKTGRSEELYPIYIFTEKCMFIAIHHTCTLCRKKHIAKHTHIKYEVKICMLQFKYMHTVRGYYYITNHISTRA